MRFTLKQIAYFVAAAEQRSIKLASEGLHISQASISTAISQLETEFGIQLFIRHHAQGLSLTPQGEHFLREARMLLQQAQELQAAANDISTKVTGRIDIGCLVTLYPLLVPELMHAFRARHKTAEVNAIADDQHGLIDRLRRGEISGALTYDLGLPAEIELLALALLPPYAFVAAGHRLAKRRAVALAALAEEPFLLLDLPLSRDYFLALFSERGIAPKIGGEFQHMDVIRSLAARGDGYGLANIRPKNRTSLDGRRLAYLLLEGKSRPLTLGLATMRGSRMTRAGEAFVALCQELVHDDHIPGMD